MPARLLTPVCATLGDLRVANEIHRWKGMPYKLIIPTASIIRTRRVFTNSYLLFVIEFFFATLPTNARPYKYE